MLLINKWHFKGTCTRELFGRATEKAWQRERALGAGYSRRTHRRYWSLRISRTLMEQIGSQLLVAGGIAPAPGPAAASGAGARAQIAAHADLQGRQ